MVHRQEAGWSESHYPSSVNPAWQEVVDLDTGRTLEDELRAELSEAGWVQEVLAEFGEETMGVFLKEYIDDARKRYHYYTRPPGYPALRVMGVDWDKYSDAGSNIVVMEFDEAEKVFRVIYREEIMRGEFTFDHAIKRIITLNEWFAPKYIYADAGCGEYQIETLRVYGMKNPESGLAEKVKRIAFGSNVDVRDPFTHTIESKPIKPFMVNQTSILLERGQLELSDYDETLWKQMENYSVVRKTMDGRPVFTSEDEHALDAMMLCILAFSLEFPELTKIIHEIHVARNFGYVKRTNYYDHVLDSLHSKSHVEPLDPAEARHEKFKRCRDRYSGSMNYGWAPRSAGDFCPSFNRCW